VRQAPSTRRNTNSSLPSIAAITVMSCKSVTVRVEVVRRVAVASWIEVSSKLKFRSRLLLDTVGLLCAAADPNRMSPSVRELVALRGGSYAIGHRDPFARLICGQGELENIAIVTNVLA